MNFLIVIIPQASVAGRVTVAAVYNRNCFCKNLLESLSIRCYDSADMTCAARNRVIQNNREDHAPIHRRVEQTSFDIGAFYSHFTRQALQ